MMGVQAASAQPFYDFCLDDHVPSDHLLRGIDGHLDFEDSGRLRSPFTAGLWAPTDLLSTPSLIATDPVSQVEPTRPAHGLRREPADLPGAQVARHHNTDRNDARGLAHLARTGFFSQKSFRLDPLEQVANCWNRHREERSDAAIQES
jgi:hypothetical protein